jgi:hypothetical protein
MIRLSSQEVSEGRQNKTESMDALLKRMRRREIEVLAFEMVLIRSHLLHRARAGIPRRCAVLTQEASLSFSPCLQSAWISVVVFSF